MEGTFWNAKAVCVPSLITYSYRFGYIVMASALWIGLTSKSLRLQALICLWDLNLQALIQPPRRRKRRRRGCVPFTPL